MCIYTQKTVKNPIVPTKYTLKIVYIYKLINDDFPLKKWERITVIEGVYIGDSVMDENKRVFKKILKFLFVGEGVV